MTTFLYFVQKLFVFIRQTAVGTEGLMDEMRPSTVGRQPVLLTIAMTEVSSS
jgi:hypothetical protein